MNTLERANTAYLSFRTDLNMGSYVVTILFTTKRLEERKKLPNCVFFPLGSQEGLVEDCVAQCETISAMPKHHLADYLGHVNDEMMAEINRAINYMIDNEY